ncbi:MAG: ATP-binding protein [Candidatus Nitrotoga sp.]
MDQLNAIDWIYKLNHLSQEAVKSEDTSSMYKGILEHILGAFEAHSGSLALLNHVESSLTIVAGIDLPDGVIGKQINIGQGILGWVVQEGKAVLLNGDVSTDTRFKRLRERCDDLSNNSAICWPLKIEGRTVGCISVNKLVDRCQQTESSPFSEEDVEHGSVLLGMVSFALNNIQLNREQTRRMVELQKLNAMLEEAQSHRLQSEKMASIGLLAAGVAHEIYNPIGYVYSNLGTLAKYVQDCFTMLDLYEQSESAISDAGVLAKLNVAKVKLDIDFLKEDLRVLMDESKDGITRVKNIVQNLKDFSRVDATDECHFADLHNGIDRTLSIVSNEINYKAVVVKEYGVIPEVECLPSQLNQVVMNLLVNASHAMEEHGTVTIRTGQQGDEVWVDIADTGKGITPEHMKKIFDPFFTTKPIGMGKGLGLSLSYGILQKHHGRIEVKSEVGKGTVFRLWLPISQ